MTKLELIKENRKRYEEQIVKSQSMTGLSRRVSETFMLEWIKGRDWIGGLSDRRADKLFRLLEAEGYGEEEIYEEFHRQMREASGLS